MIAGARAGQNSEQVMAETVALTVTPDVAAVVAGGEVTLVALVRNVGEMVTGCTLDVSGVPAGWVAVDEPSFTVDAGAQMQVPITVRPSVAAPADARPLAEPLRLVVRATLDDHANALAEAAVALTVGAPDQLWLELASPVAEGREATFHATFVNPTGAPAALALLVTAVGGDAAVPRVRVEPEGTVLVPPHERVMVTARVLPPAREAPAIAYAYDLEFRGQDVGALDDTSPYLTRYARFVYAPHGGAPRADVPRDVTSAAARGLPRWKRLLIPVALLLLAVLVVAWIVVQARRPSRPAGSVAPLPVIARFAARASVLTWQVTGATTTTLDGAPVAAAASRSVDVSHTVTAMHLLRATNQAGTVLGVVTVASSPAAPVVLRAPSIGTFALRHEVTGGPYRLAWLTHNAARVTLDGVRVPSRGHFFLRPPLRTATHYLVASNAVGQITARVAVVVTAMPTPVARSYTVWP